MDPNKLLAHERHPAAGPQRHSEQQCQRRRQLSHPRRSEHQRARHRPAEEYRRYRLRSWSRNGTVLPCWCAIWRRCKEGFQPRLGKVGRNRRANVVLGIVLLQKKEKSLPALEGLKKKIHDLNHGNLLPPGMHISTVYDRTNLINITTDTVPPRCPHRPGSRDPGADLPCWETCASASWPRSRSRLPCLFALFHDGADRAVCQSDLHWRHRFWHSRRCVDRRAGKHVSQAVTPH